ncbi:MAG: toxin-antitoxin system YwqK family antitoxin [Patiriisocius sp.]|uniref:toxin-antitoxin system YwqK family antitoxin n=1 Tax=Patiriisocius sp. TaxID=2822396 RepID=UPI003EF5AB68
MKKVKNSYVQVGDLIKATLFHENGAVAQTGFYTADNKLQGEWTSYDVNGVVTAAATYENGNKVGVWSFFDGNTKKEVTYVDSKIAKVDTWEMKNTRVVANRP